MSVVLTKMKSFMIDKLLHTGLLLLLIGLFSACDYVDKGLQQKTIKVDEGKTTKVVVGAQRVAVYHPLLKGKRVAAVVNQTSIIEGVHLVDTMLSLQLEVTKIFAPEHGFRGEADAGEKVENGTDSKTDLPLISLYGKNKKPTQEQLEGIDAVVFDIQDVGVRFYTYISTLHYVMEACAEAGIPVVVLDRPNPNAHYLDGPMMEEEFKSFVGMHPVPVVYGMTIGEYAQMINGEGWLSNDLKADLTVVSCNNYNHTTYYQLPIKPSPNLPNMRSILLYPSLCFFEGTTVSVGRGTDTQFQVIGHPAYELGGYVFTPQPMPGAKYPKHEGKECHGLSLTAVTEGSLIDRGQLEIDYLINMHRELKRVGSPFFNENNFFEKLAGTAALRQQITSGMTAADIRATWQPGLSQFKEVRKKYLLYK